MMSEPEWEGRECDVCGKQIFTGFTDDWVDFYCCEECFQTYMNREYGEGNWKSTGGEEEGENGGFYAATADGGKTWFDTGAYWTEWEDC